MITISEWGGLATNASPYSIPPGAAVTQVNLQAIVPGQISVRPGHNTITFSAITAGTTAIRSAMRFPNTNSIIYSDAAGNIRVGTGPS